MERINGHIVYTYIFYIFYFIFYIKIKLYMFHLFHVFQITIKSTNHKMFQPEQILVFNPFHICSMSAAPLQLKEFGAAIFES